MSHGERKGYITEYERPKQEADKWIIKVTRQHSVIMRASRQQIHERALA